MERHNRSSIVGDRLPGSNHRQLLDSLIGVSANLAHRFWGSILQNALRKKGAALKGESETPDLEAIVKRLEKVERQNGRLKRAGVLVVALACAVVLMGQTLTRNRVVEAETFVLRDAGGKLRARLRTLLDSPALAFYDRDETLHLELGLLEDSPFLILYDKGLRNRAQLSLSEDGSPSLSLLDKDWETRAVLGSTSLEVTKTGAVTKTAPSSLVLFDKEGKVIFQAP